MAIFSADQPDQESSELSQLNVKIDLARAHAESARQAYEGVAYSDLDQRHKDDLLLATDKAEKVLTGLLLERDDLEQRQAEVAQKEHAAREKARKDRATEIMKKREALARKLDNVIGEFAKLYDDYLTASHELQVTCMGEVSLGDINHGSAAQAFVRNAMRSHKLNLDMYNAPPVAPGYSIHNRVCAGHNELRSKLA